MGWIQNRRMERLVKEGQEKGFLELARVIVPPETRKAMDEAEKRIAAKKDKR